MEFKFSKLSNRGKYKRTLIIGIPLLMVIFHMAINHGEHVFQKFIMPIVLVIIFLVQLLYYYRQYKKFEIEK